MKKITITPDFVKHVADKSKEYNPGTRSPSQHKKHIECEVVEYYNIKNGVWNAPPITGDPNEDWKVDAVDNGKRIDCKFLNPRKFHLWFQLNSRDASKIWRQKGSVHAYRYYTWVNRPNRVLVAGDSVEVNYIGELGYKAVAGRMVKSIYIEPGKDDYWVSPVHHQLGVFTG